MPNMLHCRRGSVAFATVIALVPLIGFVALGAEAGSWYVTKQHAQNAADAAAYSGGLALACSIGLTGAACPDTVVAPAQLVNYRGKQFAAKNGFCTTGDTTSYPGSRCVASLPSGTSQAVTIDIGVYSAGTWTTNASGQFVRAIVDQQQPAYLAALLGFSTVKPGATAIAQVNQVKQLCGLGLGRYSGSGSPTSALQFAGSESLSGNGCGFQSDNTIKFNSPPTFTSGTGWAVYASQGCQNGGTCDPGIPHNFSMPPAANPLAKLDSESFNTMPTMTGNNSITSVSCSTLSPPPPVGATRCYSVSPNTASTAFGNLPNNVDYIAFVTGASGTYYFRQGFTFSSSVTVKFAPGTYYFNGNFGGGMTVDFAPGTYFFNSSAITFGGNVTCTACTPWSTATPPGTGLGVTLVLLGDSNLSISGTANVSLSAPQTNAFSADLNGVLIDDQAPNKSNNAVTINGGSVNLGGAMYFPNVDVTMGGNSANANTSCTEIIANTLKFGGGTNYLSTQNCASGTIPITQVVTMVY
jgi:Putative Flp pilus-assembly TadE/G-like